MLAAGSEQPVLARLVKLAGPAGWPSTEELGFDLPRGTPVNDVVMGTAGTLMAGLWAGGDAGREVALLGCEALLQAAEETDGGLDWPLAAGCCRPGFGLPSRVGGR